MDKQYIKDNEIVERYLNDKLSDDERQKFRVALLFDESLRQEVEDTRLLFQQIQQLKINKTSTKKGSHKKAWFWWLIAGFVILLVLIFAYFMNTSNSTETIKNTILEAPEKPLKKEKMMEEIPMDSTEQLEKIEPKVSPFELKEKPQKTNNISQPIAKVDTKVHPYLDQFISGSFRNNDTKVRIHSPSSGEIFALKNGRINLNLKGVLETNELPENERFVIRIFSNKKADFDNFKPILSANPTIRKKDNEYELSFNAILPISAGLYYFIIEDNDIEDMIYVGKFLVK